MSGERTGMAGGRSVRAGLRRAPETVSHLVIADVFRLARDLVVDRAAASPCGRPARMYPPAALVIPRGGGAREPYLVVLDHHGGLDDRLCARLDSVDCHVVADADSAEDRGWWDVADVLACAGGPNSPDAVRAIAELLRRHPGCEVVTCGDESGHLVGTRRGSLIHITGVTGGSFPDPLALSGRYGSLVHAWSAASLPLASLEGAVTLAGHYIASEEGGPGRLLVAVRDRVRRLSVPPAWGSPAA